VTAAESVVDTRQRVVMLTPAAWPVMRDHGRGEFQPESARITYVRAGLAGDASEWTISAIVYGFLLRRDGSPGTRAARATWTTNPLFRKRFPEDRDMSTWPPELTAEIVRHHPPK
jgi:hypothetical protein